MKNYLILLFGMLLLNDPGLLHAQVGVPGNNAPNKDAILDLNQTAGANKGLLLPKVALTSAYFPDPMSMHVEGMHVYNTATAGNGGGQVFPGEYYSDGGKWIRVSSAWATLGNSGTSPSDNFIGTKDGVDFAVRTNNTEQMRVNWNYGNLLVGSSTISGFGNSCKLNITNATAGAIQIKDGTQGVDKVLTSDENGVASWETMGLKTTNGTVPKGNTPVGNQLGWVYTGYSIVVPVGRSIVNAGFLVKFSAGKGYATFVLSESTASGVKTNFTCAPDLGGFSGATAATGEVQWYVNNTSTAPITLYVLCTLGSEIVPTAATVTGTTDCAEAYIFVSY